MQDPKPTHDPLQRPRRIATLNDNEDLGSSIATPSRLHKPVELFREFVWAAVAL
jgi:hypothetical protein